MTETTDRTLEEAGRAADAAELRRSLPEAPPAYLEGALENPALSQELLMILIKNAGAPAHLLLKIGNSKEWVRAYETKRALVRHPHTPHAMALNLVAFLFWRDLAALAEDAFVFPPLRRRAENLLKERMQEMALGEKIALARIAGRGLIPALLTEKNPMVMEAALWNGRLTTSDLLRAIRDSRTPPGVLGTIGGHPRWKGRADVATALLINPKTPLATSLGFLTSLPGRNLEAVIRDPAVPPAVKIAARKVIARQGAVRK